MEIVLDQVFKTPAFAGETEWRVTVLYSSDVAFGFFIIAQARKRATRLFLLRRKDLLYTFSLMIRPNQARQFTLDLHLFRGVDLLFIIIIFGNEDDLTVTAL